jgi:hypothetical protein
MNEGINTIQVSNERRDKDLFIESDFDKLKVINEEKNKIDEMITHYESGEISKEEVIKKYSHKYLHPAFQATNKVVSLYALEELFKLFKHDDRVFNVRILDEIAMSGLSIEDEEFENCYLGIMGYYCEPDKMLQIKLDTKTQTIKQTTLEDKEKLEELNTILINASLAAKELKDDPKVDKTVQQFIKELFDLDLINKHSDEAQKSKLFGNLYGHDLEDIHAVINEMLDRAGIDTNPEQVVEILNSLPPHTRILPEGFIPSGKKDEFASNEERVMDANFRQLYKKEEKGEIIPLRLFAISKNHFNESNNTKNKFLIVPKYINNVLRAELQIITYRSLRLDKEEKDILRREALSRHKQDFFNILTEEQKAEMLISSIDDFTLHFETLVNEDTPRKEKKGS